jgi:hypothetical protein
MEGIMKSDFTTACKLLEQASLAMSGTDDTSRRCRLAIEMLIEAVAKAEYTPPSAEIVRFPHARYRVH